MLQLRVIGDSFEFFCHSLFYISFDLVVVVFYFRWATNIPCVRLEILLEGKIVYVSEI
jgi:hypothetical protein